MPGFQRRAVRLVDARRALVHREIGADAMAGAMVEVEARLPQCWRASTSSCGPSCPSGKRITERPIMPFSTRVKRSFISARGRADDHRAGDVGGAVEVLPAGIDQEDLVAPQLAVRILGGMVVRDRRMRAGGGDGLEGEVLQLARLGAEGLELRRSVDLGEAALRRFRSSQWRKRLTATPSRRCAARAPSCSAAFLRALGSDTGSVPLTTVALALTSSSRMRSGVHARIDQHAGLGLAQRLQRRADVLGGSCVVAMARRCAFTSSVSFCAGDEDLCLALGRQDGIGRHDRRVRHVEAAQVEQPGRPSRAGSAPRHRPAPGPCAGP